MSFENPRKERNEKAPSLREVLEAGASAFSFVATYFEQEHEIKREAKSAFEQFLRHPDLGDRIATNFGADVMSRFEETKRARTEERTAIHRATVERVTRFRQQQTAYDQATQNEREAAEQSREVARDIDETISSAMEELADRLRQWSGRKPRT